MPTMKPINVRQFFAQFPNDETCLDHLFKVRFGQGHECPKCKRAAKWYRLASEQAFSCQWCGHHIHPMVGSIFEKSRTPLQLWFYAIFLFTQTRHGTLCVEMETAELYTVAARLGARALSVLTISDHLLRDEALPPEDRERSFGDMVEIALEAAFA
jgi:Zn ribbon nucleic-acid-binding protein